MKRKTSTDRRYKKSVWTQNQRLEAVSSYLMLGNLSQTAIVTGVPLPTLKIWKQSDWFKEYALQLKTEDVQQLDSNIRRIVEKSLKALEDRIDLGDAQFDQKTGKITRIPIKAAVALKISTELLTKQEKLNKNPLNEQVEKTIDDRLAMLSQEFARFSSMKTIEVPATVVTNE
jgi:hypothetical protein